MANLPYSMLMSLDGYTEDEHGKFGWRRGPGLAWLLFVCL